MVAVVQSGTYANLDAADVVMHECACVISDMHQCDVHICTLYTLTYTHKCSRTCLHQHVTAATVHVTSDLVLRSFNYLRPSEYGHAIYTFNWLGVPAFVSPMTVTQQDCAVLRSCRTREAEDPALLHLIYMSGVIAGVTIIITHFRRF